MVRGDAIVRLLNEGASRRMLARVVGCSEGTIRNMEIVGLMPADWKRFLVGGRSTREILGLWRAEEKRRKALSEAGPET